MPHYFSEDNHTLKSNPQAIAFRAYETDFTCTTDHGVFAKGGLDRGTAVLLKYLDVPGGTRNVLDLGCGWGAIGIVLGKVFDLAVDMTDVNPRALELTRANLAANDVTADVFQSDGYERINKQYDLIVTNPPIRIGKQRLYELLDGAGDHLTEDGSLVFVINKKHGADSALKHVKTVYESVEILGRQKGFQVIKCKKHLTT